MRLARISGCLTLLVLLSVGALHLYATDLTMFAAASLTDALREIAQDYAKQSRDKLLFNFAGSSTLARQIEEGAPADLFFSADEAQMNRLERKGEIVKGSRQDQLSNTLVIVVAAGNEAGVHSPGDLANPAVRRITLGDPQSVPIGVYARQYLEKLGLWKPIASKIVPTENVRGALAAVAEGNADASIVYKTDALVSKRVVIAYVVPPEAGPQIRYPVAIVRGTRHPEASRRFLAYLGSEGATRVFERQGFIVLPPALH